MNYITIITPENIEIEYRLAGLGSRLAAALIDLMIQLAAIFILYVVILGSIMGVDFRNIETFVDTIIPLLNLEGVGFALLIVSQFVIYYGYYVACEFGMNGQTIGKKLFKLRVIRNNGQPISLDHSIVRNLLRYTLDMTGIGIICIMINKHHKRIGDMAASTIVVAENPDLDIIYLNKPLEQSETFLNLRLNDDEYYLLVGFLERRHNFFDKGQHLHRHLVQYLAWKFGTDEYVITDEMLSKLALSNRR